MNHMINIFTMNHMINTAKIKGILIANNHNVYKQYIKTTYSIKKVSTIYYALRLYYQLFL